MCSGVGGREGAHRGSHIKETALTSVQNIDNYDTL